jgi:toxin YoeB
MYKIWSDHAWDDYQYWMTQDKKILRRINQLIKDIERSPYEGIGKPELLKHEWQGYWSRRIDDCHRIIYRIYEGKLEIAQCRAHYD